MLDKNLKALRKRFKFSQEQVAEKINVSRQTIAKWESSKQKTSNFCNDPRGGCET